VSEVPKRVVVTNPRTKAARTQRPQVWQEIDEHTELGGVYVRTLMRTELRHGLIVSGLVGGALGLIPLVLWLAPGLRSLTLLGIELPWLILGVGVYPFVLLAAWWYVRRAERSEGEFTELVDR
jgi:hypothetical protein